MNWKKYFDELKEKGKKRCKMPTYQDTGGQGGGQYLDCPLPRVEGEHFCSVHIDNPEVDMDEVGDFLEENYDDIVKKL